MSKATQLLRIDLSSYSISNTSSSLIYQKKILPKVLERQEKDNVSLAKVRYMTVAEYKHKLTKVLRFAPALVVLEAW